tara:strand:- start:572 stop:1174 length:603 start_codon:yes stop_codon:yes gene_type:complete
MEEINRIKNIQEDMKPRTSPIPTKSLLKIIKYTISEFKDSVNFKTLYVDDALFDSISQNLKLIGIEYEYNTGPSEYTDYIYAFCKENSSLLNDGNYNHEDYMIPQKKMFEWLGGEEYTAYHRDIWVGKEEGYSKEYLKFNVENGDFDITTGNLENDDLLDVFDTRIFVDSVEEVPMNERIERENTSLIEELRKLNSIIML